MFILANIGDTTRVIVSDLAVMTEDEIVDDSNDIDTEAASSTAEDATAGARRGGL